MPPRKQPEDYHKLAGISRECKKCGNPLPEDAHWRRKYCLPCRPKQKFCKDCNKPISDKAERCRSCASKVPKRRQHHSEMIQAAWGRGAYDSEETRRKKSEIKKMHWACGVYDSEETRRKYTARAKAAHARGDFSSEKTKRKKSAVSKAAWERGAHGEHSKKMKAAWKRGAYDGQSQRVKDDRACGVYRNQSKKLRAAHARGVFNSRETKRKRVEKRKAAWRRGLYDGQSQRVREAWKQGVYDGVFRSPTSIEIEVSSALDICGINHEPQYRPNGYGRIYDEFIPPSILIEVHGDYWHGPEWPQHKVRDAEKAAYARENGYHLVIMWEHEIRKRGAWSLIIERVLPLMSEGKQCAA